MTRGSPAVGMLPNSADPATSLGFPSGGVFSRLDTSARNSIAPPLRSGRRRLSDRSTLRYDGPRTGLRDDVPSVNCGAIANAAVLNQRAGVRLPAGNSGSPTRFGRCVPKPAKALKFVVCVTANGTPDCSVITVASDQSL